VSVDVHKEATAISLCGLCDLRARSIVSAISLRDGQRVNEIVAQRAKKTYRAESAKRAEMN
jgi:hypothetical protein